MKLKVKDIVLIGMMVAMLEAGKAALMILPNVEVVSLLIILFTVVFEKKIMYAIPVFVLIEGIVYGFGVWWIMYLYAWPLLALAAWFFRKQESVWIFASLSGVFGLLFGALCSIPYYFIGGWKMGISWWIAGIPYDLIHGISNFIICAVLFVPLRKIMNRGVWNTH